MILIPIILLAGVVGSVLLPPKVLLGWLVVCLVPVVFCVYAMAVSLHQGSEGQDGAGVSLIGVFLTLPSVVIAFVRWREGRKTNTQTVDPDVPVSTAPEHLP